MDVVEEPEDEVDLIEKICLSLEFTIFMSFSGGPRGGGGGGGGRGRGGPGGGGGRGGPRR